MFQPFLLLSICILSAAIAQFCLKKGVVRLGELNFSLSGIWNVILQIFQNPWLFVGMILFGSSFVVWLFVLPKFNLNIAYPISVATQIIILSVAGIFLLNESLSLLQIGGVAFIIFGIFLLSKAIV